MEKQARGHSRQIDLETHADGVMSIAVPSGVLWFKAWRKVTKPCQKELRENDVWHGNVLFDEGIIVMWCWPRKASTVPPDPAFDCSRSYEAKLNACAAVSWQSGHQDGSEAFCPGHSARIRSTLNGEAMVVLAVHRTGGCRTRATA
jgi:hypothetical protein